MKITTADLTASLTTFSTVAALSLGLLATSGSVFAQDASEENRPEHDRETPAEATEETTDEPQPLPSRFDLREHNRVTSIKAQSGGTCWTHGTMASIESHLLSSGLWTSLGYEGEPNFSEYHLDWWNGFNKFRNTDAEDPESAGMTVHQGGDYRVAAAYIARGDGVVYSESANDDNYRDKLWFDEAPNRRAPGYDKFYIRHIEWFVAGDGLERINDIKQAIVDHGAVATCYTAGRRYLSDDFVHYQPPSSDRKPNHSVAIVGWDDSKIAAGMKNRAPLPGAWLIKNSWGNERGEEGYYWISYFDKYSCQHVELGAVSFRDAEPLKYDQFYSHDYHGWRGTMSDVKRAFNAFTATSADVINAVSFYTAERDVTYNVKIYDRFEDGMLLDELSSMSGSFAFSGFHTVDLNDAVELTQDDQFFVYLELSSGGHPIDRTSEIPVLLGDESGPNGPKVLSSAAAGESFYFADGRWHDLYEYDFEDPEWATFDGTANFCIKAIGIKGERTRRR